MQKKSLVIKILVPVLIVVVIGAMWLIKNKNSTDTSLTDTQNEQTNADIPEHLKEADFSLNETSEIDFEALSKYVSFYNNERPIKMFQYRTPSKREAEYFSKAKLSE